MTSSPLKSPRRKYSLLTPFLQLPGITLMVLKRQRHYLSLTFLSLVNIVLAVGLITNASFFSQAVDRVVLLQELTDFTSVTARPPFSTQIYTFPTAQLPVSVDNAEQYAQLISKTLAEEVGLPVRMQGIELNSGMLMTNRLTDTPAATKTPDISKPIGSIQSTAAPETVSTVNAVYIANVSGQMDVLEGSPFDEKAASKDTLDVWIYDSMAQNTGLHVGEKMILGPTLAANTIQVRVAGVWKAKNDKSGFWWSNPNAEYSNAFLVTRTDYIRFIQPMLNSGSGQASWYVVLDEKKLVPRESSHYIQGFKRSLDIINKYLPGAKMNMPPLDPLTSFVQRSSTLTVLLLGYNTPAFAILLYFLALTSTIMATWQRRETVMLVSRGMSVLSVLSLTTVEQLLLFIAGYPLGILAGMGLAELMGYTSSFLAFTRRAPLPVSMEGFSLPLTILALAFALFTRLWPALRAARSSLVLEERERARPMHKPFWYRAYLDIFLLLPTYYAYDQMAKRGSLAGLVTKKPEDLFRDPLLIVVPALFILTTSLVTMRLFGWFMRLLDLIAGRIPWLALHLALRQLGRQSLDYVQPLLLVLVSLSMGTYTLSMAASLDRWTVDRMYYRNGADLTIVPEPTTDNPDNSILVDGSFIPLPGDFLSIPSVAGATRVGDFTVAINPDTAQEVKGRFLGVDRAEFPSVAWYRSDFASESLGAMMNRLAAADEGILLPQKYLDEHKLRVGDLLTVRVDIPGLMSATSDYTIVGAYTYFPTAYDDTLTIVGNLEYISTLTGLVPLHNIWLRLAPGADAEAVTKLIPQRMDIKIYPQTTGNTPLLISTEQNRLERVGIFGTLTVGFLATALMAILGLLLYSYASLHERAYRLAVLNAVGLSRRQILTQVVMEYAFLALFGAAAGALIGLVTSRLFVPFFRYTGEKGIPLPPLLPIIASDQLQTLSLIFGLIVVTVEVIAITSILRNRLVAILKRVWM